MDHKFEIREAHPGEAEMLTGIAMEAKGHWGYTAEQIESWRGFLTISEASICEQRVWVATIDSKVVGVAAIEHEAGEVVLEHLWVLPEFMGRGVGKRLFRHVAEIESEFVFTSDPHADRFYLKLGAVAIGAYESSLQKRMLTKFRYTKSA